MDDSKSTGYLQVEIIGAGVTASIPKLFPYQEDGSETTREAVLHALELERVSHGVSNKAIDYWLKVALAENRAIENCIVAHQTPAQRKGAEEIEFLINTELHTFNRPSWDILNRTLDDFDLMRPYSGDIPFCLVHEGQQIARRKTIDAPQPGVNIHGDTIAVSRGQNIEFKAGEGVYLDEKTGLFTAGVCGYLTLKNNALHVREAFYITPDKMQLFFMNLPRTDPDDHFSDKELYNFTQRNKIIFDTPRPLDWKDFPFNAHPLLNEGKPPGESTDAELELHFTMDKTVGDMDDHGRIDYKEQHKFNSIDADELLAVKKIPIRGEAGRDLFGQPLLAKMPKDIVFKQGRGVRVEKSDTEMRYFSAEEGVLEYDKEIISVFPQITINGDVGMETGHIESKANIEIMGNVLAGFNVSSKKNILVRGNIEDNCVITCGGDMTILGGVSGQETKITVCGTFSAKYVETCTLTVAGRMQVQRFLRGVDLTCYDTIIVYGHGINLNERGAIVDSEIRVRNELHVPVVGSDAGLKTIVWFAWDKKLYDHIENLTETVAKLEEKLATISDDLPVDISNRNVYSQMQSLDARTKDKVIARMQEKNKLEGRLAMMQKILEGDVAKREEMLASSAVHISKKVMPDLILHCHGAQHTFDKIQPPSRFYFDVKSRLIERSAFGIANPNEEKEE